MTSKPVQPAEACVSPLRFKGQLHSFFSYPSRVGFAGAESVYQPVGHSILGISGGQNAPDIIIRNAAQL